MKGVVFNKLLEWVDKRFGADASRGLAADALRGGGYEPLADYGHAELVAALGRLAELTGQPPNELLRDFGIDLFASFAALHPVFFFEMTSTFQFLESLEEQVHPAVGRLYPQAQFPTFHCRRETPRRLVMEYRSSRPLADLAEGLILGCAAHFGESLRLRREDLPGEAGTSARFSLVLRGRAGARPRSDRSAAG